MKKTEYVKAQKEFKKTLKEANIPIPKGVEIEVTDFGLGDFNNFGLTLLTKVNEPEYCSKWMTLLPKQVCPMHSHKNKKETFIIIKGVVELTVDQKKIILRPGELMTLGQNTWHTFTSKKGALIEEVSTFDSNADNYFKNERIIRDTIVE